MKILALMMLLTILASCRNNYPEIADQEQLSPVFSYVEIDGKKYIDIETSKCLSRTYRITKRYVGAIDNAIMLDIRECNKVVGYAPREYVIFASFLENMRRWLNTFD